MDGDSIPWDRRGGLERRRGDRRRRGEPVLFDRRNGSRRDPTVRRRLHRAIDILPRTDRSDRIHSILLAPLLDPSPPEAIRYRVTVREGLVASVYSAWERATPTADGGMYRAFDGESYRRIGSKLLEVDACATVEAAESAYEAEFERAYRLIWGQHPELRGRGEAVDGEIILR